MIQAPGHPRIWLEFGFESGAGDKEDQFRFFCNATDCKGSI